jgi:3-deoxy-manno-octulosonate cytidylyltransferase (CMP-KDO synthetase)
MTKIIAIIPARMASTRLPNKPLLDINGKPMIQHVYERVKQANLQDVIVACDHQDVYNTVIGFGGTAVMTRADHLNGSTRIAEVAEQLDADYVINVQGDEPLIHKDVINHLIAGIEEDTKCITLKHRLTSDEDIDNPNNVKVITDKGGYALYFSRSRIPYNRNPYNDYYKHIGIYGYSKSFLLKYVTLQPTPLELAESLEQLRILENGYRIKVLETSHELVGVDTLADLERVRELMRKGM